MQRVAFPDEILPVRIVSDHRMNDDEYFEFCMASPDVRFERTAEGEIIIVPPAGYESDHRGVGVVAQLDQWSRRDGRGRVSGPTAEFILPTGAALSPDAAWLSNDRLAKLSKKQRRQFPPICPEFVIEVLSPSDRLPTAKKKMDEWMRAGVQLAWLIDADHKTVYVYRAGRNEPEVCTGIPKLAGEGPVSGFELDLTDIWAGI
jgi:Uma2 family endonuclease